MNVSGMFVKCDALVFELFAANFELGMNHKAQKQINKAHNNTSQVVIIELNSMFPSQSRMFFNCGALIFE